MRQFVTEAIKNIADGYITFIMKHGQSRLRCHQQTSATACSFLLRKSILKENWGGRGELYLEGKLFA